MEEIDALEEKLKNAWNELKQGKEFLYIQQKYNLDYKVISDLKAETNIENLKSNIKNIKEEMNQCKSLVKLAAKSDYGKTLVTYIATELGYKKQNQFEQQKTNEIIRLENIWKAYKYGMYIDDIACKYHISNEEVIIVVRRFEHRLRSYVAMIKEAGDKEAEKKKLKQKFPISDDVIDYIVDGTPINQRRKTLEKLFDGVI